MTARLSTIAILIAIGCSSTRPATEALQLTDAELISALGEIKTYEYHPAAVHVNRLGTLAAHPDQLIRIYAVKALGKPYYLENNQALGILLISLDDNHWLVRSYAAKALGRSTRAEARNALCSRLLREEHPKVRKFIETSDPCAR